MPGFDTEAAPAKLPPTCYTQKLMKLGIIGLPSSGKTTIFNALTQGNAPTGQSMGGRFDVLTAVVDVRDPRVDCLLYTSRCV